MKTSLFIDRKSMLPRIWSNAELKKFAHLFYGDIANISGWRDEDKQGKKYSEYFINKKSYTITNFQEESRGFQGKYNEIFLDLTKDIPETLFSKYDVVFNHTVLEHIFDVDKAFENICTITKDIAIIVVPFLQPMHAEYGDYWRFTPTCIQKMFDKNNMKVIYCSFNQNMNSSIYVFCIATKNPEKWQNIIKSNLNPDGTVNFITNSIIKDNQTPMVGADSIVNIGNSIGIKLSKIKSYVFKNS